MQVTITKYFIYLSQRRALAYLNHFLTRVIYFTIDIKDTILEQEIIHSNQFERKNIETVNYARKCFLGRGAPRGKAK